MLRKSLGLRQLTQVVFTVERKADIPAQSGTEASEVDKAIEQFEKQLSGKHENEDDSLGGIYKLSERLFKFIKEENIEVLVSDFESSNDTYTTYLLIDARDQGKLVQWFQKTFCA